MGSKRSRWIYGIGTGTERDFLKRLRAASANVVHCPLSLFSVVAPVPCPVSTHTARIFWASCNPILPLRHLIRLLSPGSWVPQAHLVHTMLQSGDARICAPCSYSGVPDSQERKKKTRVGPIYRVRKSQMRYRVRECTVQSMQKGQLERRLSSLAPQKPWGLSAKSKRRRWHGHSTDLPSFLSCPWTVLNAMQPQGVLERKGRRKKGNKSV